MTRRCKHCNSNGHTARACSNKGGGGGGGGVRLFGVRLTDGSFYKKSASMGNIAQCSAAADSPDGYHSDDPDRDSGGHRPRIRKKGVPWTEEEHKQFLIGLQEKGKGHWLAISKSFVPSRKPSQVASHAQKYFIRQNTATTKRKRASLFDMAPHMEITAPAPPPVGADINEAPLVLSSPSREVVDMESSMPSLELSLKLAFMPLPFQLWPPNAYPLKDDEEAETSHGHIPVVPEAPTKEVVGMAKLTLGETVAMEVESSLSLSLKAKMGIQKVDR